MSEGNKSRTVAATQMNTESSRSHAVFSIVLTQTQFDPASQVSEQHCIVPGQELMGTLYHPVWYRESV